MTVDPSINFALTGGERHHPVWMRLSGHFNVLLNELRTRNDRPMTEQETAAIRGKISFLKSLIALGDDPPQDG